LSDAEPSEEQLMRAYAAGDERAFAKLFARVAPKVHGFFLQSFRDPSLADDLVQRTFLKLHAARARFRAGEPLRPWLFTIAARVRLDEYRRRYRLRESASEDDLDRLAEPPAPPDGDDAADRAAQVRAALARLPEPQRVVVHLHRYEEMAFPEIARVLGTSEGAVKQRAFRAYARLREELASLSPSGSQLA
jgi:RNA polymerase sigma-70 factor, ECF subfamily